MAQGCSWSQKWLTNLTQGNTKTERKISLYIGILSQVNYLTGHCNWCWCYWRNRIIEAYFLKDCRLTGIFFHWTGGPMKWIFSLVLQSFYWSGTEDWWIWQCRCKSYWLSKKECPPPHFLYFQQLIFLHKFILTGSGLEGFGRYPVFTAVFTGKYRPGKNRFWTPKVGKTGKNTTSAFFKIFSTSIET